MSNCFYTKETANSTSLVIGPNNVLDLMDQTNADMWRELRYATANRVTVILMEVV